MKESGNTVSYATRHSLFYKKWFDENNIRPESVRTHEDLRELPVISGRTIRENQPPVSLEFIFRSVPWPEVYTIHETSGTSGMPKSFFLTWDDWYRYAEKYARIFKSQGFGKGDRMTVCASYGMNIGTNTMTLAAQKTSVTVIPEGKCTFPVRVIRDYKPTIIVSSVFKLLRLADKMKEDGLKPEESGIKRLVIGGESFAPELRAYLDEIWEIESYNTYGSTEGSMCGECMEIAGLHVPEDLVHVDIYDHNMRNFVRDGEKGRMVLTTLVPEGEKAGTVLINYDTEDLTRVLSRDQCPCGRTHMRIENPCREAENVYIAGVPVNRVDIERCVFQRENMEFLTGEYEAFLYCGITEDECILRISMECTNPEECDFELVKNNFTEHLFGISPALGENYADGELDIVFNFTGKGELELYRLKSRPRRLVDRRQAT
ncbi:coenzyme F390 synthetase [Methanolacinia petrolearia]|uniref:coenzyme F390 synthetase n=1 Tax=Methanolacinia petrolearia TaxID=54120 RepID=UPI003BA99677